MSLFKEGEACAPASMSTVQKIVYGRVYERLVKQGIGCPCSRIGALEFPSTRLIAMVGATVTVDDLVERIVASRGTPVEAFQDSPAT